MDYLGWSLPRAHQLLEVLGAPPDRLPAGSDQVEHFAYNVQGGRVVLDEHAEAQVHCQHDDALHGMQGSLVENVLDASF